MMNMEHVVQPLPGSHAKKLWKRDIDDLDPDPLFSPVSAPLCLVPTKAVKRCSAPRPTEMVKYNLSLIWFDRGFKPLFISHTRRYV